MAKRILIVEDHQDALSILVLIVRSLGYEAMEATTGAEVIEKASFQSQPSCDGYEPSRYDRCRCSPQYKKESKYGGLTYHCLFRLEHAHMEQAASAGIAAYLIKPVPMSLMKQMIEKFVLA
jgi:CheY-like chemotaxis protein